MADRPASSARTRFTQSTSGRTAHDYVLVAPKAIKATLFVKTGDGGASTSAAADDATAPDGGDGFIEQTRGRVVCKLADDREHFCLSVLNDTDEGASTRITPGTTFSADQERTIAWTSPETGASLRLEFENVASYANILQKIQKAQAVARAIEDPLGRAMWYTGFGYESQVMFPRLAQVLAEETETEIEPSRRDALKSLLVGSDGSVQPEAFNDFLLWFGPFGGVLTKWMEVSSLAFYHGNISRDVAATNLTDKPPGSFLVRLSQPGFFAISYVAVDPEVTGGHMILHVRVENAGVAGFAMQTVEGDIVTVPTLEEVVAREPEMFSRPVANMPFELPSEVIANAAASQEPADEIDFLEAGWVEAVVDLVERSNPGDLLHAASLILAWVDPDENREPFVAEGGLRIIQELGHHLREPVVDRLVVRTMCNLAAKPANKRPLVGECAQALTTYAQSPDAQVQQYTAFIFANLVLNDPQLQQELLEYDCLVPLNALAKSESDYVQANVAWVFGNLAQHEANKKLILLGGLQSLFSLAQSENDKVKKYAFDALGCLGIVEGDDFGKLIAQVKQSLDPKPVWEIEYADITDLELVDSGGYGNVYLGKYLHMKVAVKHLKKSQLRDLEAFRKEIGMMARLRHPNIVLFIGATTNPLTMVTEYLARNSLFDVIHDEDVTLDSRLALSMARDGAIGMSYLHSLQIIHRDLKSLNLLVDESFNVKIADFGLSRVVAPDQTMTPHGTFAWRPPEMFRNEAYDETVDVYSYGIVLWELLTREIPFDGMGYEAIKKAVVSGQRPPVPQTRDPILEELIGLMQACWQGEPSARPSFDAICAGLEEVHSVLT